MTRDEFVSTRKAMNLTQTQLGGLLDLSLRQIQNIENGTTEIRKVHSLAVERASLSHAVATGDWQIAQPAIRRDAMDLVALFRGKEAE